MVLALDNCLGPAVSAAGQGENAQPETSSSPENSRFERAVSLAACIAWHFHEARAVMQFRTPEMSTPMTSAGEIIYQILRTLAYIQPDRQNSGAAFLESLAAESASFKIVITSQPQGSIPTSLWSSSYFIFVDSL